MAPIKSEFIAEMSPIKLESKYMSDDMITVETVEQCNDFKRNNLHDTINDEESKQSKKKFKGQNHNRRNKMFKARKQREMNQMKMCKQYCREGTCTYGSNCTFSHDLDKFIETERKPDIADQCYNYATFGKCNYGLLCRFGNSHLKDGRINLIDNDKCVQSNIESNSRNQISKEIQMSLRKKQYDFKRANTISDLIHSNKLSIEDAKKEGRSVPLKKKLNFDNKLYLAPLTTVGNLPFRRICKEFGADITCGEMALCQSILEGSQSEWALLRRHHTEDFFGVQICGASPQQLSRVAQLITEQCDVDFIDLNMGCPIDLIYRKGAGSALMERKKKLDEIIYSMTSVADVPLTLKMRTGVYQNRNIAHSVISTVREWTNDRIGLITLHGRSREQRYTKLADWHYINECVNELNNASIDSKPIPLFGSGDVMSHEEYYERMESSGVNGIMIARGALIKPWLFTEIKERRTWDISASERMDILKKFVNYGLENWGSDTDGVEKTRRFLLEWISFLYRYIPVGLLERLPQRINERPPRYIGRNDLETLFSSPSCKDWITISEMFLGKVPDEFSFIPKHKANAY
ncbi:tRNA-dihydrouridine(47) synthase [NAD(P)(+)]-like protein, partial [Blomia tropicalis]